MATVAAVVPVGFSALLGLWALGLEEVWSLVGGPSKKKAAPSSMLPSF